MTIELNEQQASNLLTLLDLAVKAGGLRVAQAAMEIHALLGPRPLAAPTEEKKD